MEFINNPRGFRNNNPGNLRLGQDWKNESNGSDKSFESFTSVEWGIRALFKLLDTYSKLHRINTIAGVITRYAPQSENETDTYIKAVVKYMLDHAKTDQAAILFKFEEKTPLDNFEMRSLLVAAIIKHENGIQPFNLEFLQGCAQL